MLLCASVLHGCTVTSASFSPADKMALAKRSLEQTTPDRALLDGVVTLDEAIARALKYNMDMRVQMQEQELAKNEFLLSKLGMLPKLNTEVNVSARNNETGASSEDLTTGLQNLNFSRSAEDTSTSARLEMTYNILDYGLNYIRAKQDANRIKIAEQRRRAIMHGLVRDVRTAYMRAAVAQAVEGSVTELQKTAENALARSKKAYKEGLDTPIENLSYQRDLVNIIKQLRNLQSELATAKVELAVLLNIGMGEKFELEDLNIGSNRVPTVKPSLEQLEVFAVVNRPEIAEEDFNGTIEKLEKRRVWMSMLPVIEPNATLNWDNNEFLLNNSWVNVGTRVAYSLMEPFTLPARLKNAEDRISYVGMRRDALTLAVLAQVNISYLQHLAAIESFRTSFELSRLEGEISTQITNAVKVQQMDEQDMILAKSKALLAKVERDLAYVNVETSLSQLITSIGYDMLPNDASKYDVDTLAKMVADSEKSIIKELASGDKIQKYAQYDTYARKVAFDASMARKMQRPWIVRTGPYNSQTDSVNAVHKIAKVFSGVRTGAQGVMPPVPYIRLDGSDLNGTYYVAFDTLNTFEPDQVCSLLVKSGMTCEINPSPLEKELDAPVVAVQPKIKSQGVSSGWLGMGDVFAKDKDVKVPPVTPVTSSENLLSAPTGMKTEPVKVNKTVLPPEAPARKTSRNESSGKKPVVAQKMSAVEPAAQGAKKKRADVAKSPSPNASIPRQVASSSSLTSVSGLLSMPASNQE